MTTPLRPPMSGLRSILILSIALLLRAMVMAMVIFVYPPGWLFQKAPDLVYLAHSLNAGKGLSSPFGGSTGPTAFVAPGYPALLGLVFHLCGTHLSAAGAAIMSLQLICNLLTLALMLLVADRCFGTRVATLAGLAWAVSPPLVWLPAVLWETSLSILWMTGAVAGALYGLNRTGKTYWATAGACCGAAMLVNPSLGPALCAVLGWTMWNTRARIPRWQPWLCVLTLLAVFAPWPLRNAYALHAFIPLRSNFGYELWQGNHEGATGLFDASLEPLKNRQQFAAYAAQGEVVYMREKTCVARTYIRTHPLLFIQRSTQRFWRFWAGAGSAENDRIVEAHAAFTSVLGWAGLVLLYRQKRRLATLPLLPLLLFPLPYYATHPDFRFRLVLDPILTVLSAYAVVHTSVRLRSLRRTCPAP